MNNLATLYRHEGKFSLAEPIFATVLKAQRRVLGEVHPETLKSTNSLASLYLSEGRFSDAEPILRQALAGYEKSGLDLWRRYHSQSMLGASLTGQQKYSEAEPLLVSGYKGMLQRQATIPAFERPEIEHACGLVIDLYAAWGKPDLAAEWRKTLSVSRSLSTAP
jgi:hypothetical protein